MKKSEGFQLKKVADEFVLLPCGIKTEEVGEVYTLSETAAFLYEQLDLVNSISELIEKFSEAYQVPADVVTSDVQEVLRFMKEKGILE